MEEYLLHLINILDDGLQWGDIIPIGLIILTAGLQIKSKKGVKKGVKK